MTDDIVTRLRKWAKRIECWQFESETTDELREAADEIERLRKKLAYQIKIYNEVHNRLDLWGLMTDFEAELDSDD